MTNLPEDLTHFNATKMLKDTKLKPIHFLDNVRVKNKMAALGVEAITTKGRSGHTKLPNEIKKIFEVWVIMNT